MIIKVDPCLRQALLVATSKKQDFTYSLGGNKVTAAYLCDLVPNDLKTLFEDGTFVVLGQDEYQMIPYELWEYIEIVHR